MAQNEFRERVAALTAQLAGRPLDGALDVWLNAEHGPGSVTYQQLHDACIAGVAEGWDVQPRGWWHPLRPRARARRRCRRLLGRWGRDERLRRPAPCAPERRDRPADAAGRQRRAFRRPRGRLGRLSARQRAPSDRERRPRAGAVPAARGQDRVHRA